MPRIDPLQLLKCLSVLLSPEGGIMSKEEVPRLVNLMTKFSKKLVSKCVYLLILRSTDVTLVDMFMASGGWLLIHTWLQEAMAGSNWNLVQEVLELLLVTPVDSSRLRLNNIPKLVKTLSKRDDLGDVKGMADTLVNNWLAIVKNGSSLQEPGVIEKAPENQVEIIEQPKIQNKVELQQTANEIETVELPEAPTITEVASVKMDVEDEISTGMFYKITVRDGKQVITKLASSEDDDKQIDETDSTKKSESSKKDESKSSKSKSSSSSSSSSRKSYSSSSSRDKDRSSSRHSSKHSSKSSSSSSSSSSSNRDRDKNKKDKDKENEKSKSRSNGNLKHSSSSSSSGRDKKDSKEKQEEKDKDTLAKIKPVSLDKIGRIPKKPSSEKDESKKKPTISIVDRKGEDKPKTVKVFNSKMRSTGLEEEVKPPPPRNAIKKTPSTLPSVLPVKRSSPQRDVPSTPPEKKLKMDITERAGSIKLIPPKPKPPVLQESDIFMDALTAATSKKETKKKKRRPSTSKETPEESPPVTNLTSSPIALKSFSPANFYQDTLETSLDDSIKEDKDEEASDEKVADDKSDKDADNSDNEPLANSVRKKNADGVKGVLCYFKKKGPKKSIQWKEDKDLVQIRYFELDETERINVSRTNFTDMAKLEMTHEREALMGRKLPNEDLMEPSTMWRLPFLVDQPDLPVQPGSKSLEKDIQYAREKNSLQALYFNKKLIPDSPSEPIPEIHPMVDPVMIPLEDAESQVYDLRNTPWPEPKGSAPNEPIIQPQIAMQPIFQNMPAPFQNFQQMPPAVFPGIPAPGFCPPNMIPNAPPNMIPGNNVNMNMMGNMGNLNMCPPMNALNPNAFVPSMNPMMNDNNQNFPMPFNQPPNMFQPPNNNMDRGGNRGRGGFRRNNNNNWNNNRNQQQRGGNNNNWRNNNDNRNNGPRGICKNHKNHGYCRNIESCPYSHPN